MVTHDFCVQEPVSQSRASLRSARSHLDNEWSVPTPWKGEALLERPESTQDWKKTEASIGFSHRPPPGPSRWPFNSPTLRTGEGRPGAQQRAFPQTRQSCLHNQHSVSSSLDSIYRQRPTGFPHQGGVLQAHSASQHTGISLPTGRLTY